MAGAAALISFHRIQAPVSLLGVTGVKSGKSMSMALKTTPEDVPTLRQWSEFTREEVHDLLAPNAPFEPQRGQWGLQGIVPIMGRPGDYVFFVTFGQSQGEHSFDEGVNDDGVLSWQSQPRQSLSSGQIKEFIDHDELINSIYLMLRTHMRGPYAYLAQCPLLNGATLPGCDRGIQGGLRRLYPGARAAGSTAH
jgi:hypothetical protein